MSNAVSEARACANCGAALTGPYCAVCGQKDGDNHPSLSHLAEEYIDVISHADSRIWRSLGLMVIKPGAVTQGYLAGKRASFIPPVRFYFFISLIFFLILAVANVALIQFTPRVIPVKPGQMPIMSGAAAADVQQALVISATTFVPLDGTQPQALPPDVVAEINRTANSGTRSFVSDMQKLVADPVGSNELLATWVPRLLIAVVPLFALWLWVITPGRTPLYDHMVFSLYFHTFFFLMLSVVVAVASFTGHRVPGWVWTSLLAALALIHGFFALRRVYTLSWLRTVGTFVLAVLGYVASFSLCVAAVFAPLLLGLTGDAP